MPLTRGLLLGALLAAVAAPTTALAADIAGRYKCSGTQPTGAKYSGAVVIAKKGEVYTIEWTLGAVKYTGVGILDDGVFSASFAYHAARQYGVAVYRVKDDGKLVGKWVAEKGTKINTETLTPAE